MRSFRLALVGLMLGGGLYAQQPAPPTPPAPTPARLDELLVRWEKEMQSIQTLSLECVRTDVFKTFGNTEVLVGNIKLMKPNLAKLDLVGTIVDPAHPVTDPRQLKRNPDVYEKIISTGNFVYRYVPSNKELEVIEMPAPRPGQAATDDANISFLSGMKAEDAKKRYDLKLVKEDKYYLYVEVLPKLDADKRDFQKARLVLNISNYLPRQVWFQEPNGNEHTWDVPKAESNPKLERTEFAPPATLPPGWKMVRNPRAEAPVPTPTPRVVRQGGQ